MGLPPGSATSPACVRNFIDRVVNTTCKFPLISPNRSIKTEARCFHVAAKLLLVNSDKAEAYSGGALYVLRRYRHASDAADSGEFGILITLNALNPRRNLLFVYGKRNSLTNVD